MRRILTIPLLTLSYLIFSAADSIAAWVDDRPGHLASLAWHTGNALANELTGLL